MNSITTHLLGDDDYAVGRHPSVWPNTERSDRPVEQPAQQKFNSRNATTGEPTDRAMATASVDKRFGAGTRELRRRTAMLFQQLMRITCSR